MVKKLLQVLRKIVRSRWFPTITRPILAGIIAAGLTYLVGVLHLVGLSHQVYGIATALAGLLVTAIVQKPKTPSLPPSIILDIEQIAEKVAEKLLAAQAAQAAQAAAAELPATSD